VTLARFPARAASGRDVARVTPDVGLQDGELVGIPMIATQTVDRSVSRCRRDPRTRVVGNSPRRPYLEGHGERLLHRLLGEVDVADRAGDGRDRPPGLVPEETVDDVGGAIR
jgi:hypothetical protein